MKQLFIRSMSGLVYVFVVLTAVFSPPYGPVFLACFLGAAAIMEWQLFENDRQASRPAGLLLGIFFLAIFHYSNRFPIEAHQASFSELTLALLMASLAITQAFTKKRHVPSALFHSFFGLIYITLPLTLLSRFSLVLGNEEPWLLAGVFILIWSSDTFAYLIGKNFGKRKLLPAISPNKTWEGFFGSIAATLIVAALMGTFFSSYPLWVWFGLALIVITFGTVGDLFESALKRAYDLKDSGKFMPGHGGILDRIDSLLFAVPMAYFYLTAIEHFLQ